ncbi:unnamed protein product [Oppiella nova]|uniref:Uncharacterized protein n=1 Tax=Oppiella nova TaxID=334625 RepID=A0A7R9M3R3_9ACAR|nr:unnamed protein product [Oppiella nova]CAG2168936.1 unnamed protein product [Oppiella nova]
MNAFKNYTQLTELYMESMERLHLIESGVFSPLAHLRTVYIKLAPALKNLSQGVFLGKFPELKIIRIVQTGLESMALNYMEFTKSNGILQMIRIVQTGLESMALNYMEFTKSNGILQMMNIDYNAIERVYNHAFNGSHIAKL